MADSQNTELIQKQFSQNPQGYVDSPVHAKGTDLERLIQLTKPQPDWQALDVATGGGHTARILAPSVSSVVAGDLTSSMLQAARQHLQSQALTNVSYCQLNAEVLPFDSNQFDMVTCRIAPHHFTDPELFIREAARVTRPGGIVAVIDQVVPRSRKAARYVNAFERLRDPSHAWAYSLPRWKDFFKNAGLTIWHTEPVDRRHQLTDWANRMKCAPDVVVRLRAMLIQAPEKAKDWLMPEIQLNGDASFVIHQAMILGRK